MHVIKVHMIYMGFYLKLMYAYPYKEQSLVHN